MNQSISKKMQQSLWVFSQLQPYQVPTLLIGQEIDKVLESIKQSGQRQIELELKFKRESDLQKFMKIYDQQRYEEEQDDMENEKNKTENKFKRCKDIDEKEFQVRHLAFPSFHFVNIFMKIYQERLKQLEIEYQYRFFIQKNKFAVYYQKGTKISSFFKNEIFEMKTKLNLYYCNNQTVVNKIKYSNYFKSLIEKKSIAAEHHKRLTKVDVAIFYSNVHERKSIIEIINKNLLQHMTTLKLMDKNLKIETSQIAFKLIYSILEEKIKKIRKEEGIVIQANFQRCCILVHDRHECFVDAKNQILACIKSLIVFKMEGNEMRTLFNKVIGNRQMYPYLRAKYYCRSLYCVVDWSTFQSNPKYLTSFLKLLQQYFEQFVHKDQITFYLKPTDYPGFLDFFFKISTDKNVTILNFSEFTVNEGYQLSKIILGVKDLGHMNVSMTRKHFFQIFLKIILKTENVGNIIKNVYAKFDDLKGIFGFNDPSVLQYQLISQTITSQIVSNLNIEEQMNLQTKIVQKPNLQQQPSISQNAPQLNSRNSSSIKNKQKEKKPKHIDLTYGFKPPTIDPSQKKFWNHEIRQRKFQNLLCEKYRQVFENFNFKAYKLSLKQQIDMPQLEKLEKDRIYISTIIEKNNKICYHLIDLNEFSKICYQVKDKVFFIFYKLIDQQAYVPSYTLALI